MFQRFLPKKHFHCALSFCEIEIAAFHAHLTEIMIKKQFILDAFAEMKLWRLPVFTSEKTIC